MKLVYGGYGHHPSGKQYVYWGSDNLRTGQNTVAPVTNKKTGRTYNTMFTIMRTSKTAMGDNEAQRLSQSGIGIKSIKGLDVLNDLPTGQIVRDLGGTKKDWQEMSDVDYQQKTRARLLGMEV